jgi:YD repeat-containing protein
VWQTNGIIISSFGYTLGLTGNRTALIETNHAAIHNYTWQYDALYRLTNETITGTSPAGTLAYGYDFVGNRSVRTNISGSLGPTNQSLFAYDGLGRRVQIIELTNGVAASTNKYIWCGLELC